MKLTSIAALAAILLATSSPAFALTAGQVAAQVLADHNAGATCNIHGCTLKSGGTILVKDPNVVHPGSPAAGSVSKVRWGTHCGPFMIDQFDGSCVMQEADTQGGGTPETTSIGKTHTDPTCTTTSKSIGFNPAGGLNGFSYGGPSSTAFGAC